MYKQGWLVGMARGRVGWGVAGWLLGGREGGIDRFCRAQHFCAITLSPSQSVIHDQRGFGCSVEFRGKGKAEGQKEDSGAEKDRGAVCQT